MAGLEAILRISAQDDAGAALAKVKAEIGALDKQITTFDKLGAAVGKVASAADPLVNRVAASSAALREQRTALTALKDGMESTLGATDAAAGAQARLASATERANRVMVVQGAEAVRVAEQIQAAQRRTAAAARNAGAGGVRRAIGDNLPFAGPAILHGTAEAAKAGATWQEEVTRIKAAGGTDDEIAKAREDFQRFSKTHSGVTEAEYLAGYKDARVIAPRESHEMALLGARYRIAARNSGLNLTENDVGNVMRIVDELALPDEKSREDFVGNFLKSQQAFGSQIQSETALAAYRNAKQSIYGWSPEFRDYVFPTLLQSAGQQGGTEMMTALSNYVGGHMSHAELKELATNGFVKNSDLMVNPKTGDIKGLKHGAKLFEADVFKSNIAQWSWDFHDEFTKRQGATEDGFDDIIAKMPRNMAGLIAFAVHNRQRIPRDATNIKGSVGFGAEGDDWLAKNPAAGLDALRTSIEQFSAAVTGPSMEAVGAGLQSLAHGIQAVASAVEDWAKKNPEAAKAAGLGAMGAGAATGGWLTMKLFTGIGRLLGFGGGEATGAAAGEVAGAASGGGWLAAIGGALASAVEIAAPVVLMRAIGEAGNPTTPEGAKYRVDTAWPTQREDMERSWRAEKERMADPEAARGRAMMKRFGRGAGAGPVDVSVSGQAEVQTTVKVEAGSELLRIVGDIQRLVANLPLSGTGAMNSASTGRMDGDAAPRRGPAIGGGGSYSP